MEISKLETSLGNSNVVEVHQSDWRLENYSNGLVQDYSNSIANALELLQSSPKMLIIGL